MVCWRAALSAHCDRGERAAFWGENLKLTLKHEVKRAFCAPTEHFKSRESM